MGCDKISIHILKKNIAEELKGLKLWGLLQYKVTRVSQNVWYGCRTFSRLILIYNLKSESVFTLTLFGLLFSPKQVNAKKDWIGHGLGLISLTWVSYTPTAEREGSGSGFTLHISWVKSSNSRSYIATATLPRLLVPACSTYPTRNETNRSVSCRNML